MSYSPNSRPDGNLPKKSAIQFEDLQNRVRRFCEERDWDQFHDIKELAIGVSTEAAELLELFRFQSREQCEALLNAPLKREKIEDEIADVLFFILRIAGRYDIDLSRAVEKKMVKNGARYPVDKARGSNRKYDEF
jgi:NTP pyrophosphatase (non-canonical NTP hydrolase)